MPAAALPFSFVGPLPPSKSLLIRWHLLRLVQPALALPPLSRCDDVQVMAAACQALAHAPPHPPPTQPQVLFCGEAGLVLRLLLAHVSRRGGSFLLTGSSRLLERPHAPLLSALALLGTHTQPILHQGHPALFVTGPGWHQAPPPQTISLQGSQSSQFASALVLNAWRLPFPLALDLGALPSAGYLQLSLDLAAALGLSVQAPRPGHLLIPQDQLPQNTQLAPPTEADVSSAFAIAALAAVAGSAHIVNFPLHSHQPDVAFLPILTRMGVPLSLDATGLHVQAPPRLLPIQASLGASPDLFPVLAMLCALADGTSSLTGAPQLRAKESDRIATTAALLRSLGRTVTEHDDGLTISGHPLHPHDTSLPRSFDAQQDHRLVMAAAVARQAGFPLHIQGTAAVAKSFPEFLDLAKLSPASPARPLAPRDPR